TDLRDGQPQGCIANDGQGRQEDWGDRPPAGGRGETGRPGDLEDRREAAVVVHRPRSSGERPANGVSGPRGDGRQGLCSGAENEMSSRACVGLLLAGHTRPRWPERGGPEGIMGENAYRLYKAILLTL